jgi:hypothetical protein
MTGRPSKRRSKPSLLLRFARELDRPARYLSPDALDRLTG